MERIGPPVTSVRLRQLCVIWQNRVESQSGYQLSCNGMLSGSGTKQTQDKLTGIASETTKRGVFDIVAADWKPCAGSTD